MLTAFQCNARLWKEQRRVNRLVCYSTVRGITKHKTQGRMFCETAEAKHDGGADHTSDDDGKQRDCEGGQHDGGQHGVCPPDQGQYVNMKEQTSPV